MEEMVKMIGQSEVLEFNRFPDLRDRTFDVVNVLLKQCKTPASTMISNLIQMELSYINTSHPDFIGGKAAVTAAQHQRKMGTIQPGAVVSGGGVAPLNAALGSNGHATLHISDPSSNGAHTAAAPTATTPPAPGFFNLFQSPSKNNSRGAGIGGIGGGALKGGAIVETIRLPQVPDVMRCSSMPTDKERVETEIIKTLITSYFDIVKKNFTDLVPKSIMHFLVVTFKETLQNELVSKLYNEQLLSDVMRETDDIAAKRKAYREMRELLHNATEIVNEVRDFKPN